MSYRTILMHVTDERRLPSQLALAMPIATANKARLIGYATLPPIIVVPDMDATPGTVIEEHRTTYRVQMSRMREAFLAATAAQKITSAWEEVDVQEVNPFSTAALVATERARRADLVIAGQANPDWTLSSMLDAGEDIVIGSGRPVLLTPKAGAATREIERVLLAWNGSREAARATFDAMPILAAAKEVLISRLEPAPVKGRKRTDAPSDIGAVLAAHGVNCRVLSTSPPDTGVGSTLLALAATQSVDLIVMGCYGHSRLREFVLGGATRYIFDHMSLPVLMSH